MLDENALLETMHWPNSNTKWLTESDNAISQSNGEQICILGPRQSWSRELPMIYNCPDELWNIDTLIMIHKWHLYLSNHFSYEGSEINKAHEANNSELIWSQILLISS